MQYLGGKAKIAKALASTILSVMGDGPWWDPFCGGLSMSLALSEKGPGLVSDANPALISLYASVASGWKPPETLSEDEYRVAKTLPDSDPLKAFAGFACSFGGKWFGGYARGHVSTAGGSRGLVRDVALLRARGCDFACIDFARVEPYPSGVYIYADPPYRGTTGYRVALAPDVFDARIVQWSKYVDCFVSEYECPVADPILRIERSSTVALDKTKRVRQEILFHRGPR